jgi:hypothetical protein
VAFILENVLFGGTQKQQEATETADSDSLAVVCGDDESVSSGGGTTASGLVMSVSKGTGCVLFRSYCRFLVTGPEDAITAAFAMCSCRLVEPMFMCEVHASQDVLGKVSCFTSRRNCHHHPQ